MQCGKEINIEVECEANIAFYVKGLTQLVFNESKTTNFFYDRDQRE